MAEPEPAPLLTPTLEQLDKDLIKLRGDLDALQDRLVTLIMARNIFESLDAQQDVPYYGVKFNLEYTAKGREAKYPIPVDFDLLAPALVEVLRLQIQKVEDQKAVLLANHVFAIIGKHRGA